MATENWPEVQALLLSALETPPAQRGALLDKECAGDGRLRQTVGQLLELNEKAGSFLEKPAVLEMFDRTAAEPSRPAPQRLGPYRILDEIGQGGMSVVYEAVREGADLSRTVAVKLLKPGMNSSEIERRFYSERRILASLNHPGIARIYDGGCSDEGLPYFVMELVDGLPIDRYCAAHRLCVEDRIRLFRLVCESVHYAHQRLVVHRDIKPANILVTTEGRPKLLDFGIAKLMEADPSASVMEQTLTWMRMMTPSFASPEHVRGGNVTTSSDVYSLGVVFYKLLTGRLPYVFETGLPQEIEKVQSLATPPKPSQVAPPEASSPESALQGAEAGRNRPCSIPRYLKQDLDRIAMMALRLEPERRYSSVERFSDDLGRLLAGFPISARRDTLRYRTDKFIRRHKWTVSMTGAMTLLLLVLVLLAMLYAARLERERRQTAQLASFLIDLFDSPTSRPEEDREITARELLDRGAENVQRQLATQPETRATVMEAVGRAYYRLGHFDSSVKLLEKSLHIRRHRPGVPRRQVAASLHHLAMAKRGAGDLEASEKLCREAVAMRARLFGSESLQAAESLRSLSRTLAAEGEYDEAVTVGEKALRITRARLGSKNLLTAREMARQARVLIDLGRFEEAGPLMSRSIETQRNQSGTPLDLAALLFDYGVLLVLRGDHGRALPVVTESLALRRRHLGEDHPVTAEALAALAQLNVHLGDFSSAESGQRQALLNLRKRFGERHPSVARETYNLAAILAAMGRFAEAEPLLRDNCAMASELVGEDHPRVSGCLSGLAEVLYKQGKLDEAEPLFRRAESQLAPRVAPGNQMLAMNRLYLGSLLVDRARYREAHDTLKLALPALESIHPRQHWQLARAGSELGAALAGMGRFSEAESLLVDSQRLLAEEKGEHDPATRRARDHLGRFYRLRDGVGADPGNR